MSPVSTKIVPTSVQIQKHQRTVPNLLGRDVTISQGLGPRCPEVSNWSRLSRAMDICSRASAATIDTFTRTAFGGSYNALEEPNSKVMQNYKLLLGNQNFIGYFKWALLLSYKIWKYLPMKERYALDETIKENRNAIKQFIHPRISERQSSMQTAMMSGEKHEAKVDVMARILESGHSFTEEQLMDHVFT